MRTFSLLALSLVLMLPGGAFAVDITVSAAASLTNAFTELKDNFEKNHPDIHVTLNFAASNPLLEQIRQGAPVDVFASADQETMDKAQQANLIDPASRRDFASNSLVLIVPEGGSAIRGLADLSSAKRIAVGNPDSVPAGRYAKKVLTSAGLWETLTPLLTPGENVRQVLDYVARGEVDAGFVYATDAAIAKVRVVEQLDGAVSYPVAVTAASAHKAEARAFIDFLFSPTGRGTLQKYGFGE